MPRTAPKPLRTRRVEEQLLKEEELKKRVQPIMKALDECCRLASIGMPHHIALGDVHQNLQKFSIELARHAAKEKSK